MTDPLTGTVDVPIRPLLKGRLHAVTFPAALVFGLVAAILARSTEARASVIVFTLSAALLFGVSATYHLRSWGPRALDVLRRLDHASIFVLIAGSYTPFAVLLLPPDRARLLLTLVWVGAGVGVAFRLLWLRAPRWLYTPAYVLLGWAAIAFMPDFVAAGRPAALALAATGGVLYTLGAVVYATRRPRLSPRWFGFHELFHALTVAAFVAHCVGVGLAVGDAPLPG